MLSEETRIILDELGQLIDQAEFSDSEESDDKQFFKDLDTLRNNLAKYILNLNDLEECTKEVIEEDKF